MISLSKTTRNVLLALGLLVAGGGAGLAVATTVDTHAMKDGGKHHAESGCAHGDEAEGSHKGKAEGSHHGDAGAGDHGRAGSDKATPAAPATPSQPLR